MTDPAIFQHRSRPAAEIRRVMREGRDRRVPHLRRRLGVGEREPVQASFLGPGFRLRRRLFDKLLTELKPGRGQGHGDARARISPTLDVAIASGEIPLLNGRERAAVEQCLEAEIEGLGPLAPLFADPSVSDILVNGPMEVWVDRFGTLERSNVRFDDNGHLLHLLGRLVAAQGRRLDELSPYVDVRLADGSRLNALIPPLSRNGAVLSIRRPRSAPWTLEHLYAGGTLDSTMGELLKAAVIAGLNLVISGGSGAGKTSLLSALARWIPPAQRVLTIEETAELKLDHPHVVTLEARPANAEGKGEVTLRDLVRNALRMRADRLIIGEVRGTEVFDMLQAMNTGHGGSMTTVHANSPPDTLKRLETLVLLSGFELPPRAVSELLGAAFDLIVHIGRFQGGRRRVTSIQEVVCENGCLSSRELFRYRGASAESQGEGSKAGIAFEATGRQPSSLDRLVEAGWRNESADSRGSAGGENDP